MKVKQTTILVNAKPHLISYDVFDTLDEAIEKLGRAEILKRLEQLARDSERSRVYAKLLVRHSK